jgi:glycosyltransferase involved in cell wall biosynthesis
MAPDPEVSVIVPTRDRWHILSRCALPAARLQEGISLELIVVDDGSTDQTPAGLAALDDDRVRILRNERSLGVSAARNLGIDAARGEWLAFLDDDDVWAPRKLREQVDRAHELGTGWVLSGAVTIDRERRPRAYKSVPETDDLHDLLRKGNVVPGGCSNVIVRADLVRRVGGFDHELSMLADWDLWLRLARTGTGARCEALHVGYLEHEGNMARRHPRAIERESKHVAEKYRGDPDTAIDRLAAVRWVAWIDFWSGHRARAGRLLLRAGLEERSARDVARGLRFVVWAVAPERLSRLLWRLRHRGRARPEPAEHGFSRPQWLDAYASITPLPAAASDATASSRA